VACGLLAGGYAVWLLARDWLERDYQRWRERWH
jgi:hypothetical protein